MTCHDAREQFTALVDEALGVAERDVLEAHLATCADCRRELQRFRDTVALLRAAAPVRAPAHFVDRVLETARPTPWHERLLRNLFLPWRIKLPMEAAAIVMVAVGVALVYRGSPELQQSALQEGAAPAAERVHGYVPSVAQRWETRPSDAQAPAGKPVEATAPPANAPAPDAPTASPEKHIPRVLYGGKDDKPRAPDAARELEQRRETSRAQETLSAEQRQSLRDSPTSAPPRGAPTPPAATGPQSATAPQPAAPAREADSPKRTSESQDRQATIPGKLEAPSAAAERQRAFSKDTRSGAIQQTEQRADSSKAQRPAPAPQATASLSFAPPDVSGQLAVSDREIALRSLKELLARVGAVEAYRLDTSDGPIIEIAVRREMYAELNRGLGGLGRWQPSEEPSSLPATVRVVVRITG